MLLKTLHLGQEGEQHVSTKTQVLTKTSELLDGRNVSVASQADGRYLKNTYGKQY